MDRAGGKDRDPPRKARAPGGESSLIRSGLIEAALERALAGEPQALIERLNRSSGLPGPRPNLDLARSVGAEIARAGARGAAVIQALRASPGEYPKIVAAQALAERLLAGDAGARAALQELAGESQQLVRAGVVEALRTVLAARGDAAVAALASWTDGYLQAHVALEALADRTVLARLSAGAAVVARLSEAFDLADQSPRAAERFQGVRTLRQGLPAQIAAVAARYPEALVWLEKQTQASRPETREVVGEAIAALCGRGSRRRVRGSLSGRGSRGRSSFPAAQADRLAALLAGSAPPPRDPSRVVQGTRKRSKGRG